MKTHTYIRVLILGAIAGMRSMSAPAFAGRYLRIHDMSAVEKRLFGFIGRATFAKLFASLALGEVIVDKLPGIPARIRPAGLTARVLSGALCGGALCEAEKRNVVWGAGIGGAAAAVWAYVFYYLRKRYTPSGKIPNGVAGFVEDGIVVGCAAAVLNMPVRHKA